MFTCVRILAFLANMLSDQKTPLNCEHSMVEFETATTKYSGSQRMNYHQYIISS
jgi:hypothetical protein